MLRFIGRILFHLSSQQLAETLIEEVKLGISDGCLLLDKINKREIFNSFYDIEIREIYLDDKALEYIENEILCEI